ncbi:MAG: ATP-binding protein [Gammaproteobacteria bacterium]|nr:ATP-binding protein [Gammaproteobacteria bacterium]
MITREAFDVVRTRLEQFDSVALIGPRQVGKTTLAHQVAAKWASGAKYLDLENPADRRLLSDPAAYLSSYPDQLIVLDEIHRLPEIFQVLRGQIDERRRTDRKKGKFLILGSASMDLLRQSSESLAGRISYVELAPLTLQEVCNDGMPLGQGPDYEIDRLWLQGGFPCSYLCSDESASLQWRFDFIQTYLERDLPQFGLQVVADRMDHFWRMIANSQGESFNAQRYARSLGVSGHTINRYMDVLHRLLMLRVLQPWHTNTGKRLVKSPRPYVRDSGVLHALLDLRTMDDLRSHPVAGKSWENFVIENLVSVAAGRARPYFYRTGAGAEIDLVLEFAPGRCWAIEIKLSSAPAIDRGFYNAVNDLGPERKILVYKGNERFPMRQDIEAMPLLAAMSEVSTTVST